MSERVLAEMDSLSDTCSSASANRSAAVLGAEPGRPDPSLKEPPAVVEVDITGTDAELPPVPNAVIGLPPVDGMVESDPPFPVEVVFPVSAFATVDGDVVRGDRVETRELDKAVEGVVVMERSFIAAPERKNRLESIVGVRIPVTPAASVLLDRVGSNWSPVAEAVFVIDPRTSTRAVTVKVAVAPAGRVPTFQTPETGSNVPWLGVLGPTSVSPAGNGSVTTTFVAESGPMLCRMNV
jgi:hypothetical protein